MGPTYINSHLHPSHTLLYFSDAALGHLLQCCPQVSDLDLSWQKEIEGDETLTFLKEKKITLPKKGETSKGALQRLSKQLRVTRLILSGNQLKPMGLKLILGLFGPWLQTLDLSYTNKWNSGSGHKWAMALASRLSSAKALSNLIVRGNDLQSQGAKSLVPQLEPLVKRSLTAVDLADNGKMDVDVVKSLRLLGLKSLIVSDINDYEEDNDDDEEAESRQDQEDNEEEEEDDDDEDDDEDDEVDEGEEEEDSNEEKGVEDNEEEEDNNEENGEEEEYNDEEEEGEEFFEEEEDY